MQNARFEAPSQVKPYFSSSEISGDSTFCGVASKSLLCKRLPQFLRLEGIIEYLSVRAWSDTPVIRAAAPSARGRFASAVAAEDDPSPTFIA